MAAPTPWKLNAIALKNGKCTVMHIGVKNSGADYKMEDTILEEINEEKDLGVSLVEV